MKRLLILMTVLLSSCTPTTSSEDICVKTTCSEFRTQPEAQEAFDANPACHANLDRDNDQIPCEHLPDSVSN